MKSSQIMKISAFKNFVLYKILIFYVYMLPKE